MAKVNKGPMVRHYKDENGHVHFEGIASDYVLCGLAHEGGDFKGSMVETHEGVDCEDCIGVVTHVRQIRGGQIKPRFQRRRA